MGNISLGSSSARRDLLLEWIIYWIGIVDAVVKM